MSRRIIQLAFVGTLSFLASAQAQANVPYLGGRVMSSPRIYPIFYGASWTAAQKTATTGYLNQLYDFVRGVGAGMGREPVYRQYGVSNPLIEQVYCYGCTIAGPGSLSDADVTNIIYSVQGDNGYWAANKIFLLMPGPGYQISDPTGCGYTAREGDGKYYAVVTSSCPQFHQVISRHILNTATNPNNGDGWPGLIAPCPGSVVNFGSGDIQLPWNNQTGGCPSSDTAGAYNPRQSTVLQVVATNTAGSLLHAIRYPNNTWTPYGDVKAVIGWDPGPLSNAEAQATQNVFNHVVARGPNGRLYHTIRYGTGWTPFGDVNWATGAPDSLQFTTVGVANVNDELHVCATDASGGVWHAIRSENGGWTQFGNVLWQTGGPPDGSPVVDVDCAGIGSAMHIAMVTQSGGLYHSYRFSGGWQGLGDVQSVVGYIGQATKVTIANFNTHLDLNVVTASGAAFHTIRQAEDSWAPWKTPPQNGTVPDHSSAATYNRLDVVSLHPPGILQYRNWDGFTTWSDLDVAGNSPLGVNSVGAATSWAF
jgi:hypothetical protein